MNFKVPVLFVVWIFSLVGFIQLTGRDTAQGEFFFCVLAATGVTLATWLGFFNPTNKESE